MIRLILIIMLPLTCFYTWSNTDCKSIDEIAWIIGEWQQANIRKTNAKVTHENWQRVSESTLEGVGFTLDENDSVLFQESLRIVAMQDQLFYIAKVNGNPLPIAFKADSCDKNHVKFQNLSHDFPNVIHYTHTQAGLQVAVEANDGKGFTLEFERKSP